MSASSPKHPLAFMPVSLGFLILILSLTLVLLTLFARDAGLYSENLLVKARGPEVVLSLLPASGTFDLAPGSILTVGVVLSSGEKKIKSAHWKILFDGDLVSVDTGAVTGPAFDEYKKIEVDNQRGEIEVVAENLLARQVSSIVFTAEIGPKALGTTTFSFKDKPLILDASGKEILTKAENAIYTFR